MNDIIKKHIDGQISKGTDKTEAVQDEALSDEDLDTVAGGEGVNAGPNTYSAGDGFHKMEYIDCHYCHGAIVLGEKHDCPAKKIPIR